MRLFDEFSELIAKPIKTEAEQQLVDLCTFGINERTVSNVPFTHLVSSYQASLRDDEKTLALIERTEYANTVKAESDVIRRELQFIDRWLDSSAPDDVKFSIVESVDPTIFNDEQKDFMVRLAAQIATAPKDADGEWFHKAVYSFKDEGKLAPKELFETLYTAIIGKTAGPRAGWFLSILPREWLLARLNLER